MGWAGAWELKVLKTNDKKKKKKKNTAKKKKTRAFLKSLDLYAYTIWTF